MSLLAIFQFQVWIHDPGVLVGFYPSQPPTRSVGHIVWSNGRLICFRASSESLMHLLSFVTYPPMDIGKFNLVFFFLLIKWMSSISTISLMYSNTNTLGVSILGNMWGVEYVPYNLIIMKYAYLRLIIQSPTIATRHALYSKFWFTDSCYET